MKLKHIFYYAIIPVSLCQLSGTKEYDYQKLGYTQNGKASYYGTEFHGKPTASGEKYNMYDGTAAHKRILFNSLVEVVNRENGKTSIVRINDRGPFKKNRELDLSKEAFMQITDNKNHGTLQVTIEIIK